MKYIETELKKKKGQVEAEEQKIKVKNAEDHLYELPENIRVNSAKKTEEMLSNQMLSGIPEVDLGIEYAEDYMILFIIWFLFLKFNWDLHMQPFFIMPASVITFLVQR